MCVYGILGYMDYKNLRNMQLDVKMRWVFHVYINVSNKNGDSDLSIYLTENRATNGIGLRLKGAKVALPTSPKWICSGAGCWVLGAPNFACINWDFPWPGLMTGGVMWLRDFDSGGQNPLASSSII